MTLDARQFQDRMRRLDTLLQEAERVADPAARTRFQEIVHAVLELHGAGLERLLEHVANAGPPGERILEACGRDDVVTGLLLLHDLHPLDVETRVRQALDSVRPYLRSHGGNVELLEIQAGLVRLRLEGSCHHCPSSTVTMRQTVEEAIYAKAPEIGAVEVEGLSEETEGETRVSLPLLSL